LLTNRKFKVSVKGEVSSARKVAAGVPQCCSVVSLLWCHGIGAGTKMNEGMTRAIYFSKSPRTPGEDVQLNGRNVSFVNSGKYVGVIFDRRITWRPNKALGTYMRIYSVFKGKH
jgi:hypothetical protein